MTSKPPNPFRLALQSYVNSVTEFIARTMAPESVLAIARGTFDDSSSTYESSLTKQVLKRSVRPGDLILTKTPSAVFALLREIGSTEYDHLLAVIDEERSLHISYPRAKLVPTE